MSYILRSQVGSYRFYYATFRCHVLFVGSRVAIKCWNIWTFSSDERCIAEQTESCLMPDDSWTCSWNDRDKERSFAAMFGENCARVNDHMFTGSREFLKAVWSKLAQLLSIHLNLGACYSDTFVGLCTVALALVIMFFSVSVIQDRKWQIINTIFLSDSQSALSVDGGRYLTLDQSENLIFESLIFDWLAWQSDMIKS